MADILDELEAVTFTSPVVRDLRHVPVLCSKLASAA